MVNVKRLREHHKSSENAIQQELLRHTQNVPGVLYGSSA